MSEMIGDGKLPPEIEEKLREMQEVTDQITALAERRDALKDGINEDIARLTGKGLYEIPEAERQKDYRLDLQAHTAAVAQELKKKYLFPGTGFTLFMFQMGQGAIAYASTAERASMRAVLIEWLQHTA